MLINYWLQYMEQGSGWTLDMWQLNYVILKGSKSFLRENPCIFSLFILQQSIYQQSFGIQDSY